MSKSLYLECGSGISGDMTVAALLDLGADREVLEKSLESLKLPGYEIAITRVKKSGLDACDFNVILDAEHENHDHDMAYLHGDGAEVHDHPHDHEHHHDHGECDDPNCSCHDHHHHHADEVFSSWGLETIDAVNKDQLTAILEELAYGNEYGDILRAKGMLPGEKEGEWYYFDMVPEQYEIRTGAPDYTGKVCVIGANLKEDELKKAFGRNE